MIDEWRDEKKQGGNNGYRLLIMKIARELKKKIRLTEEK